MDLELVLLKRLSDSNISKVSADTGVTRTAIYNFINGKSMTSQNLFKLSRYFDDWASKIDPAKLLKFKELIQLIVDECDPEKIILFGSQSRGDWNPESDFDLFIINPNKKTTNIYSNVVGMNLGFSFDFFVYRKENFFKEKKLQDHKVFEDLKVVYERPKEFSP